jgi:ribosomal protein S15P/S13E
MTDQSIHPRVSGGRTTSPKVNTCANSSLVKRMTRQLAGIEKHLEQHPRDGLSQQRVSTIKSILSAQPTVAKQAA